jgi:ribonuclease BN (tRNA processing enzyme)
VRRRDFLIRVAVLGTAPLMIAGRTAPSSRLILLGTAGGPTPKKTRSGSSQIIVVGDRGYVVDCGDGVARQMVQAGVFRTLRHVFLTHHHSDHNADYGNLLLLAWVDQLKTRVDTWGPPPLARITRLFFEMSESDLKIRERDEGRPLLPPLIHPHEIRTGGPVMKDDLVTVTCAVVDHPLVPLAFAYRFDCPDRSIVISGDTRPSENLVALARSADVLVHEALYVPRAPGEPGSPLRKHIMESHTSAEDAGRVATKAGVKKLVLSHLVPAETPPVSDAEWMAAARSTFDGPIVIGHDLLEV